MCLWEKCKTLALFTCGLFVLFNAACAGSQPTQSSTLARPNPASSLTPSVILSTSTPNINSGAATDWKVYTNQKYGFSFMHPDLNDACCRVAGPASGNHELIITLADENTVLPNTDAWFDGLSIYVVPNDKNLSLGEYIKQEKEALLEQRRAMVGQESSLSGTEVPIIIGGQKGVLLQGYSWDHIVRIYIPFPSNQMLLVIGKSEKSEGSFKVFDQILSTFRFAR